jgi:hypothetical protein
MSCSLLDPVFGRNQHLDWFNQPSFLGGQYDLVVAGDALPVLIKLGYERGR